MKILEFEEALQRQRTTIKNIIGTNQVDELQPSNINYQSLDLGDSLIQKTLKNSKTTSILNQTKEVEFKRPRQYCPASKKEVPV